MMEGNPFVGLSINLDLGAVRVGCCACILCMHNGMLHIHIACWHIMYPHSHTASTHLHVVSADVMLACCACMLAYCKYVLINDSHVVQT